MERGWAGGAHLHWILSSALGLILAPSQPCAPGSSESGRRFGRLKGIQGLLSSRHPVQIHILVHLANLHRLGNIIYILSERRTLEGNHALLVMPLSLMSTRNSYGKLSKYRLYVIESGLGFHLTDNELKLLLSDLDGTIYFSF